MHMHSNFPDIQSASSAVRLFKEHWGVWVSRLRRRACYASQTSRTFWPVLFAVVGLSSAIDIVVVVIVVDL